jgi:tetratricopeptide (TPR) repeat protein
MSATDVRPAAIASRPATQVPSPRRDVLLPHRRPLRPPLWKWAAGIDDKLTEFERQDYGDALICQELVGCFNTFALVEVYFGRLDHAARLCEVAIDWVAKVVRHTGHDACYGAAFDPYVNLGRLDRIHNKPAEALRTFRTIHEALELHPVSLGPIDLDVAALRCALADDALVHVLREVVIVDAAKTMLRAGMFEEALAFARELEQFACAVEGQFLREAAAVAAVCLGRPSAALETVEAHLRQPRPANAAVFWYRKAEILAAAGDIDPALTIARTLSRQFLDAGDRLGKYGLLLMLCVADLCLACGDEALGRRIAEAGRRTAQILDDVLFERECLGLLRKCAVSDDERDALETESQRLAEAAWLGAGAWPRVDPGAPRRFAAMDDLYDRLMAFAAAPLQPPSPR